MSLQNNRRYWGSSIFWSSYQPTYETVEDRGIYNKPCVHYDERAGGACTVQNGAVTVASQEGHIRLIFEGVFIAVFLTSIPFQSKIPMARPGHSRVGGALVMAASSVLGYIGQARVPFWSVVYALVTIYCGHCMPSSLLSRATETDALIVCINGVVLAMNLMLLPLTLQVASSSGTSIFLAMLLLEIELDKGYVLLSLVSTLPLDIMSHLGFIVPLIMISSTVQGYYCCRPHLDFVS